jgi:hypothetical protein
MPRVGNSSFALTCGNAAPNAAGLLAYASGRLTVPAPVLGIDIWLDPTLILTTVTATSNGSGASQVPLAIPNNPSLAGFRLFTQFVWFGPTSPPPCPPLGVSASTALDLTIQP